MQSKFDIMRRNRQRREERRAARVAQDRRLDSWEEAFVFLEKALEGRKTLSGALELSRQPEARFPSLFPFNMHLFDWLKDLRR